MNHKLIYLTPQTFKEHLATSPIMHGELPTPAGIVQIYATERGIFKACFDTENIDFAHAQKLTKTALNKLLAQKELPLLITGSTFQQKVWQAACALPKGTTISYAALAEKIGQPKAYRAVARALANNQIAYFVPCHRVIAKNGKLAGYAWGVALKAALLEGEK